MHEEGNRRLINLIFKVNKRSNGSGVRQKAIHTQMCPTEAETAFKKLIGTGPGQRSLVFNISAVHAEGPSGTPECDHS